jgi:hypothetical protein
MKEMVVKAVTDVFIELKLGDIIERLDRRVSTLADRVAMLETHQLTYEDTGHPEDEVYDAHGNIDHVATRQARLRCRLRNNTTGMGGMVIIIVFPMILMLRLNLPYLLFGIL